MTAWGGSAATPTGGLATDLSARYGADLLGRLGLLDRATATVRELYRQAVDNAGAARAPMGAADPPGWTTTTEGSGESFSVEQRFSVDAFTAWYAKQDTLASRAFAQLYGGSQTTVTPGAGVDSVPTARIDIGGGLFTLQPGQWVDNSYSGNGDQRTWIAGSLRSDALTQLDPTGNPELHERSAVWFDPAAGWVTLPQNIVTHVSEGWFDHVMDVVDDAMPVIVVGVMTWATAGAFGVAGGAGMAAATTVEGAVVAGAAFGAIGSAYGGLFNNGHIDFQDVLRGALSGAVTAGLAKELQGTELGKAGLDQAGNVSSYALRAMSITGQATLQGALQELLGGKFKDGFTTGLTQGLAQEISSALNSKIAQMGSKLSPTEASALRLLSQATGSAVRALGNPNDPASAFARDFLSSLVRDAVPAAGQPGEGNSVNASFPQFDPDLALPSADQSATGLTGLDAQRFDQLINSMAQAGDREGLEALGALLQGEAQRGSANANAGAVFLVQQQYAQLLARFGLVNQALQGLPLAGVPGQPMPDPDDPTRQAPPGYSIDAQKLHDLVNTRPADWPEWAQNLLVRAQLSAQQLQKYIGTTTFPGLVVTAAELVMLKSSAEKLASAPTNAGEPRPEGYEPHHMVPSRAGGAAMDELRQRLQGMGIDLDGATNGVWLPSARAPENASGAYHPRLNNAEYNDALVGRLAGVTDRGRAEAILADVKVELKNGTFPGVRPREDKP